jgi:hypothetical protein
MATKPSLYVLIMGPILVIAGVILYVTNQGDGGALLVGAGVGVITGNVAPSGEAFAPPAPAPAPAPEPPAVDPGFGS